MDFTVTVNCRGNLKMGPDAKGACFRRKRKAGTVAENRFSFNGKES